MSADRYAWMDAALCAQADPDTWTDITGSADQPKRICTRCPVRTACEAHAAALEDLDGPLTGIWAATSRNQRRANRHNETKEAA